MLTNKKYTVILSAELATLSATANLTASYNLNNYLKHCLYLNVEMAVGHYQGSEETSFIVHTDDTLTVQYLSVYACTHLKQECVLISYNALARITLQSHSIGRHTEKLIGSHFVPGKGDGENYTTLDSKNWSVS